MLKVLFFGTPQVAVPFLERLLDTTTVVGVVCRPDEPAGRGYEVKAPPTKALAAARGVPVFQPAGPWTDDTVAALKGLGADLGVIVAYGRILPRAVFEGPRLGSINIHFSLLPRYRGAAPMQWSLIRGETRTGVTAFWLDEGLDSGPLFHQAETDVAADAYLPDLRRSLVRLGVDVLDRVVKDAEAGRLSRRDQDGTPTLAPPLKKDDGVIRWDTPAAAIVNLVRGVVEWPGAVTWFRPDGGDPRRLKILRASVAADGGGNAGTILSADPRGIVIAAAGQAVRLEEVQPDGKKPMSAWSFWQGARLKTGDRFGNRD